MSEHFDVVVLGAGPGGYVAAIRASQLGKSVAVIEEKYWGGVCLNVGCIPSKALLRNAELSHILTHEKDKFGITGDASMDFGPTHARSRKVSDAIVKGVHFLMKKNKITEVDGWGTLTGPKSVDVKDSDGNVTEVTGDSLIIASGATTRLIPGTSLSERVVTYEEQILTAELPGSIVIAGSGAIGVEFAYVMKNFGVDVTIVEFLDRMVPDRGPGGLQGAPQAVQEARRQRDALDQGGVDRRQRRQGQGDRLPRRRRRQQVIETDKVLQAIGFAPRVEGFGLDKAGVEVTDRGAIVVDERGRTNVDGVYAIGDCTGKLMLAHTAEAMGVVAAETIADAETMEIDFDMIPRATYCQPQIASFGYSEEQAKEKGYDVKVAKFPFTANGKAQGPRRRGRLREDRRGREVQRDHRRPHDRPRRDRAAAGADPRAALGPHRRRGRPQRVRAPDARPRRSRRPSRASPAT